MSLKDKLLELNIVDNNEFLDLYVELINHHLNEPRRKYITQKHHIVPKSYFLSKNVFVDNTRENIVNLTYRNHILAHYYLAKCSIGRFKYSSLRALTYLIGVSKYRVELDFDVNKIHELIPDLETLRYIDNLNESHKNKNGKWMNNEEKQRYVRQFELDEYLSLGYVEGKLPISEKTREKMSLNASLGITGTKGIKMSDNTKKKMSASRIGKKMSENTKDKIRKKLIGKTSSTKDKKGLQSSNSTSFKKGNVPWNKTKTYSEKSRLKMSESRKKYLERIKNDKK